MGGTEGVLVLPLRHTVLQRSIAVQIPLPESLLRSIKVSLLGQRVCTFYGTLGKQSEWDTFQVKNPAVNEKVARFTGN